jgi:DNA-directed RNA polymerase specialized sigma24 family protein
VRSWLHLIATNRCRNALRDNGRRPERGPVAGATAPVRVDAVWLEPRPDVLRG